MDAARRGAEALEAGRTDDAVREYTAALAQNPRAVNYFIQRSIAHSRTKPPSHTDALSDAEVAVLLAHERGKSELIAQAQFRRAISLYSLGRYADCEACLDWSERRDKGNKAIPIWRMKVEDKIKSAAAEQGSGSSVENTKLSVTEMPNIDVDAKTQVKTTSATANPSSAKEAGDVPATSSTDPSIAKAPPSFTPASKIRHDWYQNNETVTVTLMAKGVPKDKATVELQPGTLSVSFPLPTGSDFDFSLDPLFARIDPSASSYQIMSTKIEFTLRKAVAGQKWPSLEGSALPPQENGASRPTEQGATPAATVSSSPYNLSSAPAYPTSSRTGPKNWDRVASDLSKKERASAKGKGTASIGADGGAEGTTTTGDYDDDDDDDEDGDDVNNFFKKLYRGADPDTRRAMMKSYQESNGTALSTNWSEVATRKYETSPPDGMEARKWEQ